ncbi:MAG TPA: alpha-galactosidase [Candidatus Lokiarchaeia archaeon]|nr:alpha-galactosidase [Candidatus Lokiarchaeia archaeon]
MIDEPVDTWIDAHFKEGGIPPFSFIYAGRPSEQFLSQWQFQREETTLDEHRTKIIFTYADPETMLEITCECVLFNLANAMEWVLFFKNLGEGDTPMIEELRTINATIIEGPHGDCMLHRLLGSNAQIDDFRPISEIIGSPPIYLFPLGGRSSNTNIFPIFNIEETGVGGIIVAVGWSGEWGTNISRDDDGIHLDIGLEVARLKLHPGEQIRTPRILIFPWQGAERIDGHNRFRRFLLAHYIPKKNGQPAMVPLSFYGCKGQVFGDEANHFTEENQIEFATEMAQFGPECHWIDAGWFVGGWPNGVGNWIIRDDGFPNGFRPIVDHDRTLGIDDFIVWFEPERVYDGTWLQQNHPEWLLNLPGSQNHVFNLGNDDAREWLIDHVSTMIEKEGITIYRNDYNIDPWGFWEHADEPDRDGMTEIRFVEGFYKYWDELRRRNPDIRIDNCASGGRLIDLETISRSVEFLRTDYKYFEPIGQQCQTYGLSLFYPAAGTSTDEPDTYKFRSAMTTGLHLYWHRVFDPDFPKERAHELIEEFKRIRLLYYGDYYPLTEYSISNDAWMAYQFHRDDMQLGMILAFRRDQATEASIHIVPRSLVSEGVYKVEFIDEHVDRQLTGDELIAGIDISIPDAPGAALIVYSWE